MRKNEARPLTAWLESQKKKYGSVELAADSQSRVVFPSATKMRSTLPALKDKVIVVQNKHRQADIPRRSFCPLAY
jgi:hypothetical protein